MTEMISEGTHQLSGIGFCDVLIGYDKERVNGYIVTLDNVNYVAYEDPQDGYRSLGIFREFIEGQIEVDKVHMFPFPPQEVNYSQIDNDEDFFDILTNNNGDVILRVGTTHYCDYYPCGVIEYNPENLPANINNYNYNNGFNDSFS